MVTILINDHDALLKDRMVYKLVTKRGVILAVVVLMCLAFYCHSLLGKLKKAEALIREKEQRVDKIFAEVKELETARNASAAANEGDNPQPLIVSKNVIHRKEIQEMLLEMRQQKTKKTTEMKKEEEDKVVEAVSVSPERRRQTARTVTTHTSAPTSSIGVLVIACNRPTVTRALDLLLKYRPSAEQFPIVVSQDCGHAETARAIKQYGDTIIHILQPDLSGFPGKRFSGYYKIARHFKWALTQMFDVMNFTHVVIVEDDLDIAEDFFSYMAALRPLLDNDPSVWCVSAWNDNGKKGLVDTSANKLLYRSDFFPGLGWMLKREVWQELSPKWPAGFWDDWMREPAQRKDRVCIRPELSRTHTFGDKGVSLGQFYEQHLKYNVMNSKPVDFSKEDLSYLQKDSYDSTYLRKVAQCPLLTVDQVLTGQSAKVKEVRVEYIDRDDFGRKARKFYVMDDFKAGVPRTAYHGIVSFMYNGRRVYLSPASTWKGYQ